MSNVVRFLESMGANAQVARMTQSDFEAVLAALDAQEGVVASLRNRDQVRLIESMDVRPTMFCVVFAPDEDQAPADAPSDDEKVPDDSSLD